MVKIEEAWESKRILPGGTIGVFGSGQLGRMMALAARPLGYRVATFSQEADSPTGQVADHELIGHYDDEEAVAHFLTHVDVVTFEFENVGAHVAKLAQMQQIPVRPAGAVLYATQHRLREKQTLLDAGLPVARFAAVESLESLQVALTQIGVPAILKSAEFGYDGKGQFLIERTDQAVEAWRHVARTSAILEEVVDFACEISVIAARGLDGATADYGAIENIHHNHILDISIAPARVTAEIAAAAQSLARTVLTSLGVIGVIGVEFFVTHSGTLLINEIAPRPHNSGHFTIDACATSQFEQQVRTVCALPLGSTHQSRPAVMANLLGDLWQNGTPDWRAALADAAVKLHLYGKGEARPGRKMGHLTVCAETVDAALESALSARERLRQE